MFQSPRSAADDCGPEPNPDQDDWRYHNLHQRCGLGTRWLPPQTNIVRVDGQRSVLLTIQKAGNASTLNVISGIKALLPQIKTTLPPQLQIAPLNDQSIFVRGAISGVVRETLIAACLTAFMILTFLGSGEVP